MTLFPLGDSAVVIALGELVEPAMAAHVQAVASEIERHPPAGVVDVVPAFASIAVFYDPVQSAGFEALCADLRALVDRADASVVSVPVRTLTVPVCYGGEFGPDIEVVAAHCRLAPEEVAAQHAAAEYLVHAIGFSPGFPYLGGLPKTLATPRRATPRPRVAAGSVGIGGLQTGIYPLVTPGGWNLIGRTPLSLFDPSRNEPALLRAGDRVKFQAISREEFDAAVRGDAGLQPDGEEPGAQAGAPGHVPGIEVVRAGMFTTVQDLGRRGHRARGVPLSGAADSFALRLANLLVGNPEDAAGLELTLVGPELVFLHDTVAALGGGEFSGLPCWRPFTIEAGRRIKFGAARSGCRGYLAVAGGLDVSPVLGSRSTYVRAALGGFHGRALRDGDILPVPAVRRHVRDHWWIDARILPTHSRAPVVRVIPGAQHDEFDPKWVATRFKVSSHSDRMGVRLGGAPLIRTRSRELVSSPVAPGSVQVPPDGQPIVLLADAQTIGGYPQVAHAISVDLPVLAQLRPGDTVQFQRVTLADAHELMATQDRVLALLKEGLAQKLA